MKPFFPTLLLIVLSAAFLPSCTQEALQDQEAQHLIGTWEFQRAELQMDGTVHEQSEGEEILTFNEDHSFSMEIQAIGTGSIKVTGQWSLEDDRLSLLSTDIQAVDEDEHTEVSFAETPTPALIHILSLEESELVTFVEHAPLEITEQRFYSRK
ncbi:MAG: hypothetical protein AAF399_10670 [Bacteroidota bacterium]